MPAQTIERLRLPRGIYNPESRFNIGRSMSRESVETKYPTSNTGTVHSDIRVTVSGSFAHNTRVRPAPEFDVDIAIVHRQSAQVEAANGIVKQGFRALADRLCEEHPAIGTDAEILGGSPHVVGTRLTVGKVLSKLYLYGSIQEVVEMHQPHLSEDQVKEAIAYAQDFLEIACDPHEAP